MLKRVFGFLMRSWLVRIAGTALAVFLLLHSMDVRKTAASLSATNIPLVLLGIALTGVWMLCSIVAWASLLRCNGHRLSWLTMSSLFFQSIFIDHVLPTGMGGDAVRVYRTAHITGFGDAFASFAGGRLGEMLAMSIFGLAGAFMLRQEVGITPVILAVIFAFATLVFVILSFESGRITKLLRTTCGVLRRLTPVAEQYSQAFAGYTRRPKTLLWCMGTTLLGGLANVLALVCFSKAVGADAPWTALALSIPIGMFANAAPFTISGLGLREGAIIALLVAVGVTAGNAGALAVLIDVQPLPYMALGAIALLLRRSRSKDEPDQGGDC